MARTSSSNVEVSAKQRNPTIAACLALFLGPIGFVYFSWKKAIFGFLGLSALVLVLRVLRLTDWPPPSWFRFGLLGACALFAYLDTRWTNALMVLRSGNASSDVKSKAIRKWRWRNPYLAGLLALIHPLGMLYTSIPAFLVYLTAWSAVWLYWSERPFGPGLVMGLLFGLYAYYETLSRNAAIEKWKYGLPGTGEQNPKGLSPIEY